LRLFMCHNKCYEHIAEGGRISILSKRTVIYKELCKQSTVLNTNERRIIIHILINNLNIYLNIIYDISVKYYSATYFYDNICLFWLLLNIRDVFHSTSAQMSSLLEIFILESGRYSDPPVRNIRNSAADDTGSNQKHGMSHSSLSVRYVTSKHIQYRHLECISIISNFVTHNEVIPMDDPYQTKTTSKITNKNRLRNRTKQIVTPNPTRDT
ncbi:hypothetical protein L9F63_011950, partial [Diploptera punctata]